MKTKNEVTEVIDVNEDSPWYYFYSIGCTYCSKMEPFIDELIADGNEILKLDISEPNNKKLAAELKSEYKKGCGTPWLINADTGNQICGYRDKKGIEEWLGGKDFPTPPPPKSPFPKMPYHGASDKAVKTWKKQYEKWSEENKHLPNLVPADELLKRPRAKSDPPKFPDMMATEEQIGEFEKKYDEWAKDNDHIPNLQTGKQLIDRFRNQRKMQQNSQQTLQANNVDVDTRIKNLEIKLDKLMNHLGVR